MSGRLLTLIVLWGVGPFVLLTFMLVFQGDSYQYWGDKYHSVLSSQYLFSLVGDGSLLGPLWREDRQGGNLWLVNLGTVPFMADTLLARLLHLSPVGIDLVSNLLGYAVAAGAMYLYLRQVLAVSVESAAAAAAFFTASGYILSVWTGCANDFSTTGLLPALLLLAHRVQAAAEAGCGRRLVPPWIGLALLMYVSAAASSLKTLPILLTLVVAYAVFVFRAVRPILFVTSSVATGLVLYSPWLWLFWDAARISQRVVSAFVPPASYDPQQLASQVAVVLRRVASGFTVYGVTMPMMLVVLVSLLGYREALKREFAPAKPILFFSVVAFVVCFAMDAFAIQVNDLKKTWLYVNGFDVVRFEWFASFFVLVPVAWMLDRGIGRAAVSPDSPVRGGLARTAVLVTAGLCTAQAVHITLRTIRVPQSIYPQNLVLYLYLALFLATSALALVLAYRAISGWSSSSRRWWFALLSLSVLFEASVVGYRHGVDSASRTDGDEPIMSYTERFTVPDDIALLKQVNGSDDRVVDLTRPFVRVLTTAASTALPLAGVRTPVGYGNLFPRWYDQFITRAVNGVVGTPSRWVEIQGGSGTNFAALQLLDVKYVLAPASADMPGYVPWRSHNPTGKVIYVAQPEVGPAFLSHGRHCVPSDEDALAAIHAADYATLVRRAVLVSTDAVAQDLCNNAAEVDSQTDTPPARLEVNRGHDRVTVEVASEAGGILTLADTYYPGWRAFVDGVETPILRTYTTLRGVVVGAGRHRVEFVFSPVTFWALFWMSGGLLALLVGTAGWMHWASLRSRSHATAEQEMCCTVHLGIGHEAARSCDEHSTSGKATVQ